MTFDASAHPRDTSGQFAEKTGTSPELNLAASLSRFSGDDVVPLEDVDWDEPVFISADRVDSWRWADVTVSKASDTAYDITAYRTLPGDTSDEYQRFLEHEYNATFEKYPSTGSLYLAFSSRYDTIDHPDGLTEADVRLLVAETAGVYDRDEAPDDRFGGTIATKYWAWRDRFELEEGDAS